MKRINNYDEYIFESLINESVIYLSDNTISIFKALLDIPEERWGRKAFIKSDNGKDMRYTSGAATDNKKRVESGTYISKQYIDDYINSILSLNGKFTDSNKYVYVDLNISDNKMYADVITDLEYKKLVKMGTNDEFGLPSDLDRNPGQVDKITPKLKSLHQKLNLNIHTKLGGIISKLDIKSDLPHNVKNVIIEEIVKKTHVYMNNGQFEKDMSEVDTVLREVDGKEIGFWYKMDNYVDADMFKDSENTLHKSCMRDGEKADVGFFDLYITNPNQVKMLVYYDNTTKKLFGRALIWISDNGEKIMDVIYAVNNAVLSIFEDYKKKHCGGEFVSIKLDNVNVKKYPFLDTFKYLNIDTKELSMKNNGGKLLQNVFGGETTDMYSEYEERYLTPNDSPVQLYYFNDWVSSDVVDELDVPFYTDDNLNRYALSYHIVEISGQKYCVFDDRITMLSNDYYENKQYIKKDETVTTDINDDIIMKSDATIVINKIDLADYSEGTELVLRPIISHKTTIENDYTYPGDNFPSQIVKLLYNMFIDSHYVTDIYDEKIYDTIKQFKSEREMSDSLVYISDEVGNNIIEYINKQIERLTGESYYIDGNGNIVFSMCYDDVDGSDESKTSSILSTMIYLVDGGQINHKSLINHKDLFYKNDYIGDLLNRLINIRDNESEMYNMIKTHLKFDTLHFL